MPPQTETLRLDGPEATARFARALAPRLTAGCVLLLSGPVGAGKTHFARALILALLEAPEDIPSPTYTLVQTYPGQTAEIWHADLYRLTDTAEIEELGLAEAFGAAICLVEWPDRLGDLAPEAALWLDFAALPGADEAREITLRWTDPAWATRLREVVHAGA